MTDVISSCQTILSMCFQTNGSSYMWGNLQIVSMFQACGEATCDDVQANDSVVAVDMPECVCTHHSRGC